MRISLADVPSLASLHVSDLALASRCVAGDSRALSTFHARYRILLEKTVHSVRALATPDDVVQNVLTKLLVAIPGKPPRLSFYAGRGELGSWLRVTALREALSSVRKTSPELSADDFDDVDGGDDQELLFIRRRYGPAFRVAFARAVQACTPRDRNLLRYSLVRELSIDEIGSLYGVHRATAARWVQRAKDALVSGTRAELAAELGLGPERLDSLMQTIKGHVELSLGSIGDITAEEVE